eukprot:2763029-Karenia_brevis.AAC.1
MDVPFGWILHLIAILCPVIPKCNLASPFFPDVIHGDDFRLGPGPSRGLVIPKCKSGSFPPLFSFMVVTLRWVWAQHGLSGSQGQFRIIPFPDFIHGCDF